MFGRKKTYICLYEYKDPVDRQVLLDFRCMKRSKAPEPTEFIRREKPTGRVIVFEANVKLLDSEDARSL